MRLSAYNPVKRRFPSAYLVRITGTSGQKCVSFTYMGFVQQLTLFRISNISSPSLLLMRRLSKSSNSRSLPSVSTLTPSVFTHMVTHIPHAPHRPSTHPRKSTATYTTFAPQSALETGGSIRVILSSSRRTPVRAQWANIHRAMPLCPASLPITP